MKRSIQTITTLTLWLLFVPLAEAINITLAEVQNGLGVVQGNKAEKQGTITWEGSNVTEANNGGSFKFVGVVPLDCVGTLSDGPSIIEVVLVGCTPSAIYKTGQTTSYATGDDGDLEAGAPLASPRFTDNGNGTITDNATGLIWLKNANCPGTVRDWQTALDDVAQLNTDGTMNSNNCGDTSKGGVHQNDWRLPNIRELFSLVHFGFFEPALSNAAGTARGSGSDPFTNFQTNFYWSSTTRADNSDEAWLVVFVNGQVFYDGKSSNFNFVLAVRGP